MRSTFFAHPKRVSAAVWASSMFSLLIPTCLKLTPLGNSKSHAKGELDLAQHEFDNTLQELNGINEQIREARQRVLDLDCAMAGYPAYNDNISAFQQTLHDSELSPIDALNAFWHLPFANDKTVNTQSIVKKSWDELNWEYDYFYSCFRTSCGRDSSCCWDWGWHFVTHTYYYNEITDISNNYKNILQGTDLLIASLNCGYYSRAFKLFAPETYMTYQSPKTTSGDRNDGLVFINFQREFGSRVLVAYELDKQIVKPPTINVFRSPSQMEAAVDLTSQLYQFLIVAIAAFNATGSNYSATQESIRDHIPALLDEASAVDVQLKEKQLVLANKQAIFDNADDEFTKGLSFWLPIFFLVPAGLSISTYLLINPYKSASLTRADEYPPPVYDEESSGESDEENSEHDPLQIRVCPY